MSLPQHLRVIGSRRVFQHFLPPIGNPFPSSEFSLVKPGQAGPTMENFPDDDLLTIVVNPDEYEIDGLTSLRGVVWLWFLEPVFQQDKTRTSAAPRLAKAAEEPSTRGEIIWKESSRIAVCRLSFQIPTHMNTVFARDTTLAYLLPPSLTGLPDFPPPRRRLYTS